jgi:hypothetical protein
MKKVLFTVSLVFASFTSQAQDYYHSAGIGFFGAINHVVYSAPLYGNVDSRLVGTMPLMTYKACLGSDVNRKSTFGLTAYPSVGGTLSTAGSNFGFALPVAAEMYFGDVDDNHFKMGLGVSYARITLSSDFYSEISSVFGPTAGMGFQTEIRDKMIEINLNYTYGLTRSATIPTGATVTKDVNHGFSVQVLYSLDQ